MLELIKFIIDLIVIGVPLFIIVFGVLLAPIWLLVSYYDTLEYPDLYTMNFWGNE